MEISILGTFFYCFLISLDAETESQDFLAIFGNPPADKRQVAETSELSDKDFERYHRDLLGFYK